MGRCVPWQPVGVGRDTHSGRDAVSGNAPAAGLVLSGVFALQGAATVATGLIPLAGIPGAVALRLGFGSIGLLVIARPDPRRLSRRGVALAVVVGLVLAVHHLCFYAAIHRLPLGVAVTFEFLGPLAVALASSRRASDLAWATLAGRFTPPLPESPSPGGSTCWESRWPWLPAPLGPSTSWSSLDSPPSLGGPTAWPSPPSPARSSQCRSASQSTANALPIPHVVLLGALVALLADVIAYSLQAEALSRLTGRLFSILTSTEPAAAALFGLIFLVQRITVWQWAGIAAVTAAAIAAA